MILISVLYIISSPWPYRNSGQHSANLDRTYRPFWRPSTSRFGSYYPWFTITTKSTRNRGSYQLCHLWRTLGGYSMADWHSNETQSTRLSCFGNRQRVARGIVRCFLPSRTLSHLDCSGLPKIWMKTAILIQLRLLVFGQLRCSV